MAPPNMLRVIPTGDLPVPTHDGKKHKMVRRHGAPPEGHLVHDNVHNRRRIQFGELTLLAEGADALPRHAPLPTPAPIAAPAAPPAVPAPAPEPVHEAAAPVAEEEH